jgi:hypothetical protein
MSIFAVALFPAMLLCNCTHPPRMPAQSSSDSTRASTQQCTAREGAAGGCGCVTVANKAEASGAIAAGSQRRWPCWRLQRHAARALTAVAIEDAPQRIQSAASAHGHSSAQRVIIGPVRWWMHGGACKSHNQRLCLNRTRMHVIVACGHFRPIREVCLTIECTRTHHPLSTVRSRSSSTAPARTVNMLVRLPPATVAASPAPLMVSVVP